MARKVPRSLTPLSTWFGRTFSGSGIRAAKYSAGFGKKAQFLDGIRDLTASRDKLSCRILRQEHSHKGINSVVKVSEIKVGKRVNLTYLNCVLYYGRRIEALLHVKKTLGSKRLAESSLEKAS